MSEDRPLITVDGAILVLLTAAAYGIAFQYDETYTGHFGLASSFVEFSLHSLYRSAMWVTLTAGIVFVLHVLAVGLFESVLKAKMPLAASLFAAAAILYAVVAVEFDRGWYWATSGGFILVLLVHLVAPIFTSKRKHCTYAEKLAMEDARIRAHMSPPHLPHRIAFVVPVIMVTALALQVAQDAGGAEASKQLEFLVADTSPPCAIVRPRGDSLICAEFSRNQLTGTLRLLSKEGRGQSLTLRKVGPLRAAPAQTPLPTAAPGAAPATTRPAAAPATSQLGG